MPDQDRREGAEALSVLENLIERMDALGRDAEDAAARITRALPPTLAQAHKVITDLPRRESDRWRQSRG